MSVELEIINRIINPSQEIIGMIVQGDKSSIKLSFKIKRFFNGVDLSKKNARVGYLKQTKEIEYDNCTITQTSETHIIFDWIVNNSATSVSGDVEMWVEFSDKTAVLNKRYIWKTNPTTINIEETFEVMNSATNEEYTLEKLFYSEYDINEISHMVSQYPPLVIEGKEIIFSGVEDFIVEGDSGSQILSFSIDRYINGTDVSTKAIAIKFKNALGETGRSKVVNIIVESSKIYFSWLIDGRATKRNGTVEFAVEVIGYDENEEFYIWSTKTKTFEVTKSLDVENDLTTPTQSWLQSLEIAMDNRIHSAISNIGSSEQTNVEVVLARGEEKTLGDRLDKTDNELSAAKIDRVSGKAYPTLSTRLDEFASQIVLIFKTLENIKTPTDPVDPVDPEPTDPETPVGTVTAGVRDIKVIPDEYNTGIEDGVVLTQTSGAGTYGDVTFVIASNGTMNINMINSKYQTTTAPLICENFDFTGDPSITVYNEGKIKAENPLTIIFNNCKFKTFTAPRNPSYVKFIFNHCEIFSAYSTGMEFNWCKFGGNPSDGINPLRDVTVNNCYFRDFIVPTTIVGAHVDGVQIYGYSTVEAGNIHFNNCRMEMPQLTFTGNTTYVNACIMLQLEYNSGSNITFNDCIINGGGYAVYCWVKNNNVNYTLTDVEFNNVRVGCTPKWGLLYHTKAPDIDYSDIKYIENMYVSTVWKDEDGTIHLSVSNDTNQERTLVVVTSKGVESFTIPKCLLASEYVVDVTTFSSFPFDIDVALVNKSDWVVCYDGEITVENQIRFVNWGTSTVIVDENLTVPEPTPIVITPTEPEPVEPVEPDTTTTLIERTSRDITVVPDEYNTGVEDSSRLVQTSGAGTYGDIIISLSGSKTVMNMYNSVYQKSTAPLVCEYYDFTGEGGIAMNGGESISATYPLTVIFNNCKFSSFTTPRNAPNVKVIFNHCEIRSAFNSGAEYNWCKFGGGVGDGMNPLKDVTVNNCYFRDFSMPTTVQGGHSDGVQIYGYADIIAGNIHFNNCRFEAPNLTFTGNTTYVNACLAIGLEYSSGDNMTFNDCILNGGGYTIYSGADAPFTLTNVEFNNIRIGCSHKYGIRYIRETPGIDYSDIKYIENMYVSSVWNSEDGFTHLSVSNDTNKERTLTVVTPAGVETFTVPKCLVTSEFVADVTTFADFPFDIDIKLSAMHEWVICYDGEIKPENQIRFVNWTDESVRIKNELFVS